MLDRTIDIFRELNPSFVLTHALEDPYNFDHPTAAHFAQEARVIAQAMGHKPEKYTAYAAAPVFLFEPHQPEQCNFKPQVILNIDEVWETKIKAFQVLAAQKHLWEYYNARRAQSRRPGWAQLRQADDLRRGLSAPVSRSVGGAGVTAPAMRSTRPSIHDGSEITT